MNREEAAEAAEQMLSITCGAQLQRVDQHFASCRKSQHAEHLPPVPTRSGDALRAERQ